MTTVPNDDAAGRGALAPGQAGFFDNVVPALPSGDYQLIVQQAVEIDGQAEPPYASAQRFRVAGSRVVLGPTDVVAMSPAAGSQGSYDTWLPHVVLAQRDLPWQVPLADGASQSVPWLALLLLTRDEIDVAGVPPTAGVTGAQTVPLAGYLEPPAATLGPQLTRGLASLQVEQPGLTCTVVDVAFDAFRAVAPQTAELPLLTHVRQVDTSDQEELQVPAPGWYSIVIGNRFPVGASDDVYIAHLVSLEGFAGVLPDQAAPTGLNLVRLISLASWSFTSTLDPGDFAALMQALDVNPLIVPVSMSATDTASQLVARAISEGYTALAYTTRLGEQTTAWYRGPFQPAVVNANAQPPYEAAAAALVYDPDAGMFDASYAAAWEIGRLLTLANGPVAVSMSQWVATSTAAARLLLERDDAADPRERGSGALPALDAEAPRAAARELVARKVVPSLLGRSGSLAALGPPADPTGLRGRTLPGLVDAATVRQLLDGDDPYAGLCDHAITTARVADPPAAREPASPEEGAR